MATIPELLQKQDELLSELKEVNQKLGLAYSLLETQTPKTTLVAPTKPEIGKPNIIQVPFSDNQYVKEQTEKVGWVLHHTAGSQEGQGVYDTWAKDTWGRVSTGYVINRDGTIVSGFDAQKYWGFAIGIAVGGNNIDKKYLNSATDYFLNKRYVQIEICSWGGLTQDANGNFLNYTKRIVPKQNVVSYNKPFRGFLHFEKYTEAQIESVKQLILWHHSEFGLSKKYNPDMWDISENALQGKEGLWTHNSFRTNKSDIHPQPEMIQMLQSL